MTLLVGVSEGTAGLLGLRNIRAACPPRTAYLMVGEKCLRHCAFCGQSARSHGPARRLSRVGWPTYSLDRVSPPLQEMVSQGMIRRACLQVVHGFEAEALEVLKRLVLLGIPVNASMSLASGDMVESFLSAGAERVSLPLDAAESSVYSRVKGGDFDGAVSRLLVLARDYPSRISTHLIAGLGETEMDLLLTALKLETWGVAVGLFAFTPLAGTPMEKRPPPDPVSYRRLQAALYLIKKSAVTRESQFTFDGGSLSGIRLRARCLHHILGDGEAFRTSGCEDCNRPYYNESARGFVYNYPRPLDEEEAVVALEMALRGLVLKGGGPDGSVRD